MRMTLWAVSAASIAVTPAMARDHYYFSKPGVSRDSYVEEVSECSELAGGVSYRRIHSGPVFVTYQNTTAGTVGAGLGLILGGILASSEARRAARRVHEVVERTCMADKGYRRMKVDKAFLRDVEAIKDERARIDRFFDFASAEHPAGQEIGE